MTAEIGDHSDRKTHNALAASWWTPMIRGALLVLFEILVDNHAEAALPGPLWFISIY